MSPSEVIQSVKSFCARNIYNLPSCLGEQPCHGPCESWAGEQAEQACLPAAAEQTQSASLDDEEEGRAGPGRRWASPGQRAWSGGVVALRLHLSEKQGREG